MLSDEYADHIASSRWRATRKRFLATCNGKCEGCGSTAGLHVHHATYRRFGDERVSDLRLVCQKCHAAIHQLHDQRGRRDLWKATRDALKAIRKGNGHTYKSHGRSP